MNVLKKLWKFFLFIIPITRSKIEDVKEILEYVDGGLELLEKQNGYPLTHSRSTLRDMKRGL